MKSKTQNQSLKSTENNDSYQFHPYIHDIKPNDIIYEESEADSIERCPHDEENPYVMVSVEIIRNKDLSPACRWLLCYLLSNSKGWNINRRQVANHIKEFCGRDKTDKIFEEAMRAGYMKKVDILVKRKRGGALKRCKYFISEMPRFKKCFQNTPFQGTGNQTSSNTGHKVIASESNIISNNPPSKVPIKKVPSKTTPSEVSLRSEEEEKIHLCLEGTSLSPKDKLRLTKQYTQEQVVRALKISETQTIKKSLMHLLLNILMNPESWETPMPGKTPPKNQEQSIEENQKLALQYNEILEKQKGVAREPLLRAGQKEHAKVSIAEVAKANTTTIMETNCIVLIIDGFLTKVSLKSSDFAKDIKVAIQQIK